MQIPPTFEQQKNPGDKGYARYLGTVLIRMWGQLATVVNYGIQLYNMQSNGFIGPGNIRGYVWTAILPLVIIHLVIILGTLRSLLYLLSLALLGRYML